MHAIPAYQPMATIENAKKQPKHHETSCPINHFPVIPFGDGRTCPARLLTDVDAEVAYTSSSFGRRFAAAVACRSCSACSSSRSISASMSASSSMCLCDSCSRQRQMQQRRRCIALTAQYSFFYRSVFCSLVVFFNFLGVRALYVLCFYVVIVILYVKLCCHVKRNAQCRIMLGAILMLQN